MKNYTPAELKVMDDFADYRLHEGDRLLKEEAFEQAGEAYKLMAEGNCGKVAVVFDE